MGDFNARIQRKLNEQDTPVGKHTLDKIFDRLGEHATDDIDGEERVIENRNLLLEHCIKTNSILSNTFFEKPDSKLFTYKNNINENQPPYTRRNYETLDYVITPERWKNCVKNVETDKDTNVYSDHITLIATIQIKLKADKTTGGKLRQKYAECTEQQRYDYNCKLNIEYNGEDWNKWLKENMETELPQVSAKRDKIGISEHIEDLIKDRGEELKQGNIEKTKELNKEIKKQKHRDKQIRTLEAVSHQLDIRQRSLGLRNLAKEYKPMPFALDKEEHGK